MATDVIIDPSTGQIYWNDSAGVGTESISIKGDAVNTISIIGYGAAFSPGSTPTGAQTLVSIKDSSGTDALIPGTTGYNLGSSTLRWNTFATNANLSGTLVVADSTISSSLITGSVRFNGGIAISGNASIGQSLNFYNSSNSNYVGFKAGVTGANTLYTLPTGFPSTGTSVLQSDNAGTLSWVAMASGSGSGSVNSGTATFAAYYASTTNAVSENANLRFTGTGISVGGNINSSSTLTGSFYVFGGLGISGNAFIGGTINISSSTPSNIANLLVSNSTASTSTASGALVVTGGAGVGGSLYVGGASRFSSSTVSTSVGTGALTVTGGAGIAGSLYVGEASRFTSTNASTSSGSGALTVSGGVGIGGSLYVASASRFESNINSTSINVGGIVATGGVGIGLSLSIGGRLQLFNSSLYTAFLGAQSGVNTTYTLPATSPATGTSVLQSTSAGILSWVPLPAQNTVVANGSYGYVQYSGVGNAFTGNANFQYDDANDELVLSNFPVTTLTNQSANLKLLGTNVFVWSGSDNGTFLAIGAATGFSGDLIHAQVNGVSRLQLNADGYLRLGTAGTGFTLPITNGTSGQVLTANTNGIASWTTASGSPGGSNKQIQYNNSTAFGGASGFEYTTGGTAVTVAIFSPSGTGYTAGMWIHSINGATTRVGIGLSNPQFELEIAGEISATNKSFVIDHPTKTGMKLRYGSLEGPENGVYIRGELNNSNVIEVPEHWLGLVHEDSYTVHLTPIGKYAQLYVEKIENYNVFVADNMMCPIHCYYSVWAERKDIPKLITEY